MNNYSKDRFLVKNHDIFIFNLVIFLLFYVTFQIVLISNVRMFFFKHYRPYIQWKYGYLLSKLQAFLDVMHLILKQKYLEA